MKNMSNHINDGKGTLVRRKSLHLPRDDIILLFLKKLFFVTI
jgi:hypothetical protein